MFRWAGSYIVVFVLLYSLWPLRNFLMLNTLVLGSTAGAGSTFYTYLIVPQEAGGTDRQADILAHDPTSQMGAKLDPIAKEKFFWRAGANPLK